MGALVAKPNGKKVVVAMSGGVDSSVAAALLLRQGYEVIGVFMRLGSPDGVQSAAPEAQSAGHLEPTDVGGSSGHKQGCCSITDAADARRVAGMLGIPFYVLNFQKDFARIIDYFVGEYNSGRTPNPCVRCNDWLKFGKLHRYAQAIAADYVASGHYARAELDPVTGRRQLLRGRDHRKDQSYVLFGMSRDALEHTLLPIGDMEKPAVRALAEELKLPVFNKPDSQEICFVPDQDYAALVRRRAPDAFSTGVFVDTSGQKLGTHEGHQQFTIGQRKGLGVATGHPLYVVQIDAPHNTVTLGARDDLLASGLRANQVNLLDDHLRNGEPTPCLAKIRYNQPPQAAIALLSGPDELTVRFGEPQSAITPGQAVVLYDGDVVLGGAWIQNAIPR